MVSFHDSVQEIHTHQNDNSHSTLPLVSRPSQVGQTLVTCLPQAGGRAGLGVGSACTLTLCPGRSHTLARHVQATRPLGPSGLSCDQSDVSCDVTPRPQGKRSEQS